MHEELWEKACWLLLAFRSGLSIRCFNTIIRTWCKQQGRTLLEFLQATDVQEWGSICQLDEKTITKLARMYRDESTMRPIQLQELPLFNEQLILIKDLGYESVQMLTIMDKCYPERLKLASDWQLTPPVLFYAGDLHILENVTVAIIGSRNASEISQNFTHKAAQCLAEQGVNVVSGYARGVDRAAYEGATSTQGYTSVILPNGMNKLSTIQMCNLLPKIEAGKVLLLSQFHPDAPWMVSRAMERNKVVTGLAHVVIVAEANLQGGTWHGALGALEQQRSVYVCQATDLLQPGNRALIERGACPLYWSTEDSMQYRDISTTLAPLLQEGHQLRQDQPASLPLAQQITYLLKEQQFAYNQH